MATLEAEQESTFLPKEHFFEELDALVRLDYPSHIEGILDPVLPVPVEEEEFLPLPRHRAEEASH